MSAVKSVLKTRSVILFWEGEKEPKKLPGMQIGKGKTDHN